MNKKYCNKCQTEKCIDDFAWKHKDRGIRTSICKECHKLYSKTHYTKDTSYYKNKAIKNKKKILDFIREFKQKSSCSVCGDKRWYVLHFHHRDSTDKIIDIAHIASQGSIIKAQEELDKCDALCANCHLELHYFERNLKPVLVGIGTEAIHTKKH